MSRIPFRHSVLTIALLVAYMHQIDARAEEAPSKENLADVLVRQIEEQEARVEKAKQVADAAVAQEQAIAGSREELNRRVTDAEGELVSLCGRKPELDMSWQNLQIGEFESDAVFAARKEQTKAEAKRALQDATAEWEKQVRSAEKKAEDLRTLARQAAGKLEEQEKASKHARVLADADKGIAESLRGVFRPVPYGLDKNSVTLPRFDRQLMAFEFPIPKLEEEVTAAKTTGFRTVRIKGGFGETVRVKMASLEDAQKFKEKFEAGDVACYIWCNVRLTEAESPVLMQERNTQKKTMWLNSTGLFGLGGNEWEDHRGSTYAAAPGGAAVPIPSVTSKEVDVEVQPEIKRQGIRYHFSIGTPGLGVFLDSKGDVVPWAPVELPGASDEVKKQFEKQLTEQGTK